MSLEQTETEPPIDFNWSLSGPNGARFILYPLRDIHTHEDVKRASGYLHRTKKVTSLQVRWLNEREENLPEKIPDALINKELQIQLGQKESYIQELETKLNKENTESRRQLKKEIQSEEEYKKIKEELRKAKKDNDNLRQTISDLVTKLNQKK